MRSPKSAILRLLDSAAVPIYLLDPDRVIVFANRSLGAWQGIDAAELVGHRCEYHSAAPGAPHAVAVAHRLCPPPECSDGETMTLRLESVSDASQSFSIQFTELRDVQGELVGILAVGQPFDVESDSDRRLEARHLHELVSEQRQRLRVSSRSDVILGVSPQARRLRQQVALAAKSSVNVLIVGSSGSGRERCARAIHALASSNESNPLIPLDCALLDAELLQSTVAAFLQSCAELESPGVPMLLLLDVDRLEEPAQRELEELLAIEELALRVLATAQVLPSELIPDGRFRGELAEQLGTLVIRMPRLVERREDIPFLAQSLVEHFNALSGRSLGGFTANALELLVAYDWPGGYSELVAVVEEATNAAVGPLMDRQELVARLHEHARPESVRPPTPVRQTLDDLLAAAEKTELARALKQAKGNKAKAARLLGIPRARLLRRIEHFQLEPGDPRRAEDA